MYVCLHIIFLKKVLKYLSVFLKHHTFNTLILFLWTLAPSQQFRRTNRSSSYKLQGNLTNHEQIALLWRSRDLRVIQSKWTMVRNEFILSWRDSIPRRQTFHYEVMTNQRPNKPYKSIQTPSQPICEFTFPTP